MSKIFLREQRGITGQPSDLARSKYTFFLCSCVSHTNRPDQRRAWENKAEI